MRYLTAAEQTGNWLLVTAERRPQGRFWPVQPGVSAEVIPGLDWGTAGFVDLHQLEHDDGDLAFAFIRGDDILDRAIACLRRHLAGDPRTVRWPHARTGPPRPRSAG